MLCEPALHKRYWRLYHLLDLDPPASTKQVRWTFRKVTLRHHYYQAYLTLYNKDRKHIYDALGESGYGFISSGAWGPLIPLLGSATSIILYAIVMLVEVAMLIVFFALLGVRVDDTVQWSWDRVLVPLMIFAVVMTLTTLLALIVNLTSTLTRVEGMALVDRLSPVGNFLASVCYLALVFVMGAAVKDGPTAKVGSYTTYLILPIVGDVLYYLTSLIWRWPSRTRRVLQASPRRDHTWLVNALFAMAFAHMGCAVAQWVVLGQKIDLKLRSSWYVAFLPFAVRAVLRVVEAIFRTILHYRLGLRSTLGVAFDVLAAIFVNGILLVSLYFVAVRIEKGKSVVRMVHALIPVYVTLAYIFLSLIGTTVYLLWLNRRSEAEEKRSNYQWIPPAEKDSPDLTHSEEETILGPMYGMGQHPQDRASSRPEELPDRSQSAAGFPDKVSMNDNEDLYSNQEVSPSQVRSSPRSAPRGTQPSSWSRRPVVESVPIAYREYNDPYDPKTDADRVEPMDSDVHSVEEDDTSSTGSSKGSSYTDETSYLDEEETDSERDSEPDSSSDSAVLAQPTSPSVTYSTSSSSSDMESAR